MDNLEELKKELSAISEFPNYLRLKILPNAQKTEVSEKPENGDWKIKVKAVPEKGKANKELLKFLKKELKIDAEIISGEKDRLKLIKILSIKN